MLGFDTLMSSVQSKREKVCSVNALANVIRTVDGTHKAGAGELADGIADSGFLKRIFDAGVESRDQEIDELREKVSSWRCKSEESQTLIGVLERRLAAGN